VTEKLFNENVDLDDPRVLFKLSLPEIQEKLINLFVEKFKDMTFVEKEPEKRDFIKLSDTKPFTWTKKVYSANKCIFNYIPCDNDFEVEFAKFLDKAEDVFAFTKIVQKIPFFVEYKNSEGNLRLYYPDFVLVTENNEHFIIETKGREDIDVIHKDKRIKLWCQDATKLTKSKWIFKRIDQQDFQKYRFRSVKELISTLKNKE